MKRVAVISDIHGNLEALKVVLRDIKKRKIEKIICLGDVIGYGPDPEECLKMLLQQDNITFIIGNHESMFIGETSADKCSQLGRDSQKWTSAQLDGSYKQVINTNFKKSYEDEMLLYTHASYPFNLDWKYSYSPDTYKQNFDSQKLNEKVKFVFLGHSHRPQIFALTNGQFKQVITSVNMDMDFVYPLQNDVVYCVNVGSVGQARDGVTKACYVQLSYDTKKVQVSYKRLRYMSFITYFKIIERELGGKTASFLIQEKWRKKLYEYTYNWGKWFFRILFKAKI